MNILILSPFSPSPPNQGGKIRIFNIIKNLSKSHNITLACIVDDESAEDVATLREFCDEIVLVERPAQLWKDRYRFLLGNKPYNVIRYASDKMWSVLNDLLKRKSFDLVQIEFSMMWQYAAHLRGIPIILDEHNIEYEIVRSIGKTVGNPAKRFSYILEEKRLKALEQRAWRECSLCFAVSEKERSSIASSLNEPGKVVTIPNGVDIDHFQFLPKAKNDKRVLIIGGMDYLPNLDSAKYFLHDIFPLIQSKVPEAKVDIVGRELWRIKDWIPAGDIDIHENVPSIVPFFRKADILVVPLRMGAGTRIKILEAFAAGVPVVSTSKGCEGITIKHNEHLLIADTADAFVSAIDRMLNNDDLRKSLAHKARTLVEKLFSWKRIIENMEKCYESVGVRSKGETL